MDYTLAGIRQQVLVDRLDDDEFDPQVADNFINHAQRDIFRQFKLPFMEKIFSGSLPTGSTMFALPADVALPQSFTLADADGNNYNMMDTRMEFRPFNEQFPVPANNEAGPITNWTLYAGQLITSAPTDQDYTMTMFYYKTPVKLLQDTDVPQVPEEFSELLVLGALKRIHERNEDYDLAGAVTAEYTNQLSQMVDQYGYRIADGPIIMKNRQTRTRNR